jgi:phosphomannomutase
MLGSEMEEQYIEGVLAMRLHPEVAKRDQLCIAYTPLHGVGGRFIKETLARAGYTNLHIEPSQAEPDGTFPTVAFPNPEEPGAMDLAMALGKAKGADLIIANDPDTDRLAVGIPEGDGFRMLTGDQVGVLLADYLLTEGPKDHRLVATTIVSSQLLGVMAGAMGVDFEQTLTGFKWIANTALAKKEQTGARLVMGYEEALGYTIGELVRDKDGVSATLLFCELAAHARAQGSSVRRRLEDIYRRHGLYVTRQVSITMPGSEGLKAIAGKMKALRAEPPKVIAGYQVADYDDLDDVADDLPRANVLVFRLEGGARVLVRPSGTEPKLKSYYEIREPMQEGEELSAAMERAEGKLGKLANGHQAELAALG